jgi:hypothetical protein
MSGIYLIFTEQKLKKRLTYSVFVRVWYSQSVYAVFKSSGVTVLSKPYFIEKIIKRIDPNIQSVQI